MPECVGNEGRHQTFQKINFGSAGMVSGMKTKKSYKRAEVRKRRQKIKLREKNSDIKFIKINETLDPEKISGQVVVEGKSSRIQLHNNNKF